MRSRRRSNSVLAIVGLTFVVTLVAVATSVGAASPTAENRAGASSGTFVMARASDVYNFDPANSPDQVSVSTALTLFDRLVRFAPHGTKILPDLATSWKFSNNNKTVIFRLRPGVRFSDGTALTPADVAFSIERATKSQIYSAIWGDAIKKVTPVGSSAVRIDLKRTFAPLLSTLATFAGGIYSEKNWKRWGKAAPSHPLGTAAFNLTGWTKGSQIVLSRNPYYWGPKPALSKVIFKVVGSDNARVLQLRSGAVDAIETVPPNQAQTLKKRGFPVQLVTGQSTLLIPMNEEVKPFEDKNVRLALAYALDRAAIAKNVYFGLARVARSVLPSGTLFYQPKWPIPYDLSKAKAFLAKSSVPKGFTFNLTVPAGNLALASVAQIWAASLQQIGVTVKIQEIEAQTAFSDWLGQKYQVYTQPWANDTPDAMEYARLGFAGQKAFFTGYTRPGAVALAAAGEATLNPAKRQAVYSRIQQIIAQDQPQVYAVHLPLLWASSSKVKNFSPNAQGDYLLQRVSKTG
jgi:peptide/nickel transport system substrate-binding protein